eukprot:14785405-Alexandrium_andersonii.AAC.1
MSASLVGSEMCIRDSSTTLRRFAPTHACAAKAAFPSIWHSVLTDLSASVSYTHLTLPTICSV